MSSPSLVLCLHCMCRCNCRLCLNGRPKELKAFVYLEDDELCLRLPCTKSQPSNCVLRRGCWCKTCDATCPVHVLGPFFASKGMGSQPFAAFTPKSALLSLRAVLRRLSIPREMSYRLSDLARGHSLDLMVKGTTLDDFYMDESHSDIDESSSDDSDADSIDW